MRRVLALGLLMIGLAACQSTYTNSDVRTKPIGDNVHPRTAGR